MNMLSFYLYAEVYKWFDRPKGDTIEFSFFVVNIHVELSVSMQGIMFQVLLCDQQKTVAYSSYSWGCNEAVCSFSEGIAGLNVRVHEVFSAKNTRYARQNCIYFFTYYKCCVSLYPLKPLKYCNQKSENEVSFGPHITLLISINEEASHDVD